MISKIENFTPKQQELAAFAKLLSHPARVAILEFLAKENRCISGDITNELPLSRTTLSQHLQELKNSDLIKGEIEGKNVCYCINWKTFSKMEKLMKQFIDKSIEAKLKQSCC